MKTLHFAIAYRTRGMKAGRAGSMGLARGRRASQATAGAHIRYITRAVADAGAHADYVTRSTYRTKEDLIETGHGNLPAWARQDPIRFFEQSAQWERHGGRTATQITAALPRDLTHAQQRAAVEDFVQGQLGTQHAYVWGMHETTARDGRVYPHVHIAFCERAATGQDLPAPQYFSARGYQKNRTFNDQGWPAAARQAWADTLNVALEQAGAAGRVDARSFRAQEIPYEATVRIRLDEIKRHPAILDGHEVAPDTPAMQQKRAAAWEDRKQVLGLTRDMTHDEIVHRIGDASREAILAHQTQRRQLGRELGSDELAVTRRLAVTQERQETARQLTQAEQRYVQHPEQPRSMQHLTAVARLLQSTEDDTPQRRLRRHLGRNEDDEQGQRRGYGFSR